MPLRIFRVDLRLTLLACILAVGTTGSSVTGQAQDKKSGCVAEVSPPPVCRWRCHPAKLKLLHYAEPEYPEFSRKAGVQGRVVIQAFITEKEDVTDPMVVSGHPLLAGAVIAVVREWVYQPVCLNGSPVAIEYYFIVVTFMVKDGFAVEG
jgi:protein TonB